MAFGLTDIYAATTDVPLLIASQKGNVTNYSISIKILAVMTLMTVLPALLITTTAFTRIIIVMAILRQAIGIPNVPGNQILIGLSLIMTLFVMIPVINKINDESYQPYIKNQINEQQAVENALQQLKTFMLKQTHKKDLKLFYDLSKIKMTEKDVHPF